MVVIFDLLTPPSHPFPEESIVSFLDPTQQKRSDDVELIPQSSAKISSEGYGRISVKICTTENFPLIR